MKIGINGNEANIKARVGVNEYALQILKHLESEPEIKKHQVIVYLKEKPLSDLPSARPGWEYRILFGKSLWLLKNTIYFWLNKDKLDVFFSPSHYAPLFLRIPSIISIMDIGYLKDPSQFRKTDFLQLKYWTTHSIKQAEKIIAISESTKVEIEKYYKSAKGKITVIHLGYKKEEYKNSKIEDKGSFRLHIEDQKYISKTKKKYGIQGEYVMFLGTLKPNKNIERLIEAFGSFTRRHVPRTSEIKLIIAGKKGWLYESVFEKVKILDLADKVIFTGFVEEDDKQNLLAGAKVFVSPSLWEGFGLSVLEALAWGTPVIISNTGSLPEIAGDVGITVNPSNIEEIAQAIEKVVTMPNLQYNKLKERSRKQAQKFSWEKTAKKTLEVLESANKYVNRQTRK